VHPCGRHSYPGCDSSFGVRVATATRTSTTEKSEDAEDEGATLHDEKVDRRIERAKEIDLSSWDPELDQGAKQE